MLTTAFTVPVAPEGPGTPFGTPGLIVFDSLRVLVFVLGLLNLALKPWLFRRCDAPGQVARIAALGMLSVVGMSVELEHLGDYANWRLFFVLVAMVINTWGNYSLLRYEAPAQILPDRKIAARRDAERLRKANEDRQRFHGGTG
jgi:hypothetical protein